MFWFAAEIKPGSVAFLCEGDKERLSAGTASVSVPACVCVYWGARARSVVVDGIIVFFPHYYLVFLFDFPASTGAKI